MMEMTGHTGDGDEASAVAVAVAIVVPAPIIPTEEQQLQGDKDDKQQQAAAVAWEKKAAVAWKAWRTNSYIPTVEEAKVLLELADDMDHMADVCFYCSCGCLLLAFSLGCVVFLLAALLL